MDSYFGDTAGNNNKTENLNTSIAFDSGSLNVSGNLNTFIGWGEALFNKANGNTLKGWGQSSPTFFNPKYWLDINPIMD